MGNQHKTVYIPHTKDGIIFKEELYNIHNEVATTFILNESKNEIFICSVKGDNCEFIYTDDEEKLYAQATSNEGMSWEELKSCKHRVNLEEIKKLCPSFESSKFYLDFDENTDH